jgi:hypothetical protein
MVRGFVKMRDYGTAINLSVFAHRALEYIKSARHFFHANNGYYANMYRDAYIGMALGVADGAKSVAQGIGTFVAHPIDTSLEIAIRLDHLCNSLQRCAEKICDVGDKLLINPREGVQDLMGYYQKLNEAAELLRDRIEKTSLSTACRHTTKFITETVLTGEVLKVVGLGCRAIKAESLALINEIKAERAAESIIATTAEGIEIRSARAAENAEIKKIINQSTSEGIFTKTSKNELAAFSEASNLGKGSLKEVTNSLQANKNLNWTNHRFKHAPHKNLSWKQIIEDTKFRDAKYSPNINIEAIERYAWEKGIPTTNNKTWKVIEFDEIIGAKSGVETKYMRVECSANTIHGHPITFQEYKRYLK